MLYEETANNATRVFREGFRIIKKMNAACVLIMLLLACNNPEVKDVTSAKEKKIEKINFFMETSGSMAGYLNGSTEFRKKIPNLLVNIEGKIDSGKLKLHNYYINDSIVPYQGSTRDFINAISTKQPAKGKSSEMHKIFSMVAAHTDSNDISIFVSDCILSYSDDVLRQKDNRNINRDNAEGELKATMTAAFIDLQKKNDICASVFGFNSGFVGTYYTFQNDKIQLKGDVQRPYYIWVIGNKELLVRFNRQLNELESFKPHTLAMDFGVFEKPISDYKVLFSYQRKGDWSTDYKAVTGMDVSEKQPASFAIVTDLSLLPPYARDTSYLRKMLRTAGDNLEYSIGKIELAGNISGAVLKDKERVMVNEGTHVITLDVHNVFNAGNINLTLPFRYDTTYRSQSIMDDRNVAEISGKTFAFQHLIDGVREAYQHSNQYYITISIPIKK